MCDLGEKLVIWLDGELSRSEAAEIERHVKRCEECRERAASYKQISGAIVLHCQEQFASQTRPSLRLRGAPVVALGAAAAVVLLFVGHAKQRPLQPPVNEVVRAVVPDMPAHAKDAPASRAMKPSPVDAAVSKPVYRHRTPRVSAQPESQQPFRQENWVPAEAAVQITIPAESMFAPGAVPQGVSFSAELIVAADGSAESVRLRP
jgi:anti-sigma factor RsiW